MQTQRGCHWIKGQEEPSQHTATHRNKQVIKRYITRINLTLIHIQLKKVPNFPAPLNPI